MQDYSAVLFVCWFWCIDDVRCLMEFDDGNGNGKRTSNVGTRTRKTQRSEAYCTVPCLALLALPGTILAAGCRGPTWKIEMRLVLGSGGFVVSSGLR